MACSSGSQQVALCWLYRWIYQSKHLYKFFNSSTCFWLTLAPSSNANSSLWTLKNLPTEIDPRPEHTNDLLRVIMMCWWMGEICALIFTLYSIIKPRFYGLSCEYCNLKHFLTGSRSLALELWGDSVVCGAIYGKRSRRCIRMRDKINLKYEEENKNLLCSCLVVTEVFQKRDWTIEKDQIPLDMQRKHQELKRAD